MALGLQNAFGGQALSDAIRQILATRKADDVAAQAEAYKRQQDAIRNALQSRTVGVSEANQALARERFSGIEVPESAVGIQNTHSIISERDLGTGIRRRDDAATQGVLDSLSTTPVAPGRMAPRSIGILRRSGITIPEADLLSPEQRGAEAGKSAASEWAGGTGDVFRQQERIKADNQIRAANARIQSGVAPNTDDLDKLADFVAADPEQLRNLDIKTRTAVINHMAQTGTPQANGRQAVINQMLDDAIGTIETMRKTPGFRGAVGAKGPSSLFGLLDEPMAGTDAAGFAKLVDTLKAKLTLPKLQLMRGMGALSDAEGKRIENATTSLDRRLGEGNFTAELDAIYDALVSSRNRRTGATPMAPGASHATAPNVGGYIVKPRGAK